MIFQRHKNKKKTYWHKKLKVSKAAFRSFVSCDLYQLCWRTKEWTQSTIWFGITERKRINYIAHIQTFDSKVFGLVDEYDGSDSLRTILNFAVLFALEGIFCDYICRENFVLFVLFVLVWNSTVFSVSYRTGYDLSTINSIPETNITERRRKNSISVWCSLVRWRHVCVCKSVRRIETFKWCNLCWLEHVSGVLATAPVVVVSVTFDTMMLPGMFSLARARTRQTVLRPDYSRSQTYKTLLIWLRWHRRLRQRRIVCQNNPNRFDNINVTN